MTRSSQGIAALSLSLSLANSGQEGLSEMRIEKPTLSLRRAREVTRELRSSSLSLFLSETEGQGEEERRDLSHLPIKTEMKEGEVRDERERERRDERDESNRHLLSSKD